MAELFNNRPGVVAVLDTDANNDNPFRVTLDGFPQSGAQSGVIFTELAIQRHGNFQFLHTLQDLVYAYSFGERLGQLRASGLAFAQMCNGVQGLSSVLAYYEMNRLEVRPDPISIIIGTSDVGRFRGFLTELNASVARPEARLAQFGLQFHALPSTRRGWAQSGGQSGGQTAGQVGAQGGSQSARGGGGLGMPVAGSMGGGQDQSEFLRLPGTEGSSSSMAVGGMPDSPGMSSPGGIG